MIPAILKLQREARQLQKDVKFIASILRRVRQERITHHEDALLQQMEERDD